MRVPRVREVWSSNSGPAKSTQRCKRCATASTSIQVAVLPWRYDAEMGTANSLHASAKFGEYNERFGFGNGNWNLYITQLEQNEKKNLYPSWLYFFEKNILKKKCNEQYLFSHICFDVRVRFVIFKICCFNFYYFIEIGLCLSEQK